MNDSLLRGIHRLAQAHGYSTGFTNCEEGINNDSDRQVVRQRFFVPQEHCILKLVKHRDLGVSNLSDIIQMYYTAFRWARGNADSLGGAVAAIPTFEQGLDSDGEGVSSIAVLRGPAARIELVPETTLGVEKTNVTAMFVAASRHSIAVWKGMTGFPTFHEVTVNGVLHHAIAVINPGQANYGIDLEDALYVGERVGFANSLSQAFRARVIRQHARAIARIAECSNIRHEDRSKVRGKYRQHIGHESTTTPGELAHAFLNGNKIFLHEDNLSRLNDDELGQTLIHEMMHCIGCTHRARESGDTPYDGGEYYGSEPLRAELCIAGKQSLRLAGASEDVKCSPGSSGEYRMG
jgi:hypothetical protein